MPLHFYRHISYLAIKSSLLIIVPQSTYSYLASYGTAQFKLDSAHVQQEHDITHFHFTSVQACVCTQDW